MPSSLLAQGDADVSLRKDAINSSPNEGESFSFRIIATNLGPNVATNLAVADTLPAGLVYESSSATQGSYDPATSLWSVGSLSFGASDTLMLTVNVGPGTAGTAIRNTARIAALDQNDATPANDQESADIVVLMSDLDLQMTVEDPTPTVGDSVSYWIAVTNMGPHTATGIVVNDLLPSGLTFAAANPSRGSYDPGSGDWSIGAISAAANAVVRITALVDPGTAGQNISNSATIVAVDQADPDAANNAATVAIDVIALPSAVTATLVAQGSSTILPGLGPRPLATLDLVNAGATTETLTSLTLRNDAVGPGDMAQMDGQWTELQLRRFDGGSLVPAGTPDSLQTPAAFFSGGLLTFSGLEVQMDPSSTVVVEVWGGASHSARDTDQLRFAIPTSNDMLLASGASVNGTFALVTEPPFIVDGMTSAQIKETPVPASTVITGSKNNVALDVVLPANGYQADQLDRLNVVNLGSAVDEIDVTAIRAWIDDGDASFNDGLDTPLGEFSFTGARWELTGLTEALPVGGLHLFVTVDVAAMATQGATIQLSLPAQPDVAVGAVSGNDGPVDQGVSNPFSLVVSATDRVALSAVAVADASVRPGEDDVVLMRLVATNDYPTQRTLRSVAFSNVTAGTNGGDQSQRDSQFDRITIRVDGDDDAVLDDEITDPVIATAFFSNGRAVATGLDWALPTGRTRHLWVLGDVSLLNAADGEVLGAIVQGAFDISFAEPTAVSAAWPLDSLGRFPVDGMQAAQLSIVEAPGVTLGPDDGPTLALDITVPANGYADDLLTGVELVNLGTASASDIAQLTLYRDDGDGQFDAADPVVSPLVPTGPVWRSTSLSEAVTPGGLRLFVGLTVSSTPTDSSSVRLAIPVDGITMASGNDGPQDVPVENDASQILSSAPLLASLSLEPVASTLGQGVVAKMIVRNVSGERIEGIRPSTLSLSGAGALTVDSGPVPAQIDLDPATSDTLTWSLTAASVGEVQVSADAEGTGNPSGLTRRSLRAVSNLHRVLVGVDDLTVFPVESPAFSLNRGQTGVPLSLTFSNPLGPGGSDVVLRSLQLRVEDETGTGLVPADVFSAVQISEGSNLYVRVTSLPGSGSDITLNLGTTARVTSLEPVTLSISLDVAPTTTATAFRLAIVSASSFDAVDNTSGATVPVQLGGGGTFPIQSGLGQIATPPGELRVASTDTGTSPVGQGQVNVLAARLDLENPGAVGLTSTVDAGAVSFCVVDNSGVALQNPGSIFTRLQLVSDLQILAETQLPASGDSTISLNLAPPLAVDAGPAVTLSILADVADTAPPGNYRIRLHDPSTFAAWDANSADPVPVTYVTQPLVGVDLEVQIPAQSLSAVIGSGFQPTHIVGETSVAAMSVTLTHAGGLGTGAIAWDLVTLECQDASRNPVVPASFLDQVRLLWNGSETGLLTSLPGSGGSLTAASSRVTLLPGESGVLGVEVDFSPSAPTELFELIIRAVGINAADANTGAPVAILAGSGTELPMSSGVVRLVVPATELQAGLRSRLPAALVAAATGVDVAQLDLVNPAPAGAGAILVDHLVVGATDASGATIAVGSVVSSLTAMSGSTLWSVADSLDQDSTVVHLVAADPLQISPEEPAALALTANLQPSIDVDGIRFQLERAGIGVVQPGSALLVVRIEPEAGQGFPLRTEAGTFSGGSLTESFANFPNPFAAGRDHTTFVFNLETDSVVDLRLLSPRGNVVRTLIAGEGRSAGLHQDQTWDGRNGRGRPVLNGVYLAELTVRKADGSTERVLRKVAVVR